MDRLSILQLSLHGLAPHLIDKARTLWPKALVELPMFEPHKQALKEQCKHLHTDFRLPDC